MAARKVASGRGRIRIALLMIAFLMITGIVILRRSFGLSGANELLALEAKRAAMVNEKLRLEGEIRSASSRAHLMPAAERLNLHVPADSMVIPISRGKP
jgi:hypothetical protein